MEFFLDCIFRLFVVSVEKCNLFLNFELVSYDIAEIAYKTNSFSGIIWIFYVWGQVICKYSFNSFPIWTPFISCLIVLVGNSSKMLNRFSDVFVLFLISEKISWSFPSSVTLARAAHWCSWSLFKTLFFLLSASS